MNQLQRALIEKVCHEYGFENILSDERETACLGSADTQTGLERIAPNRLKQAITEGQGELASGDSMLLMDQSNKHPRSSSSHR